MSKPGKVELKASIQQSGGVVADIAEAYGVSRQTVYNWLDHYQLREMIASARTGMMELAEDVVFERVTKGDFEAAKFVLERLGKGKWSKRTELTGRDGAELFAPDVMAILRSMGVDPADAVTQFEEMVRQQATISAEKVG